MTKNFIFQRRSDENSQNELQLHYGAEKQAKECFRHGLGLVKDIFRRFSNYTEFNSIFTQVTYDTLVSDQLILLKDKYISEKSQLIEILCSTWPSHMNTLQVYLHYPEIIPSLMMMLQHKSISSDVSCLHMSFLKKLIEHSLGIEKN